MTSDYATKNNMLLGLLIFLGVPLPGLAAGDTTRLLLGLSGEGDTLPAAILGDVEVTVVSGDLAGGSGGPDEAPLDARMTVPVDPGPPVEEPEGVAATFCWNIATL